MKICELCGKEHDGSYGSGRFCSKHCRDVYSAKSLKNGRPYRKQRLQPWVCDLCGKEFKTRKMLYKHKHEVHNIQKHWCTGLTKETDKRIAKISEKLKNKYSSGKIKVWCSGKNLSNEVKSKISESMKKAHCEGRAHNIGQSRWNNEPSYPEKWFIKVIENNFIDKNYIREFPFHKYSLDFAWINKKLCIEIDGDQHQHFEEYRKRDIEKDKLLLSEGWKILRLSWKYIYNNSKEAIQTAKNFIDNC